MTYPCRATRPARLACFLDPTTLASLQQVRQRPDVLHQLRLHVEHLAVNQLLQRTQLRHVVDVLDVEQLLEHLRPDVLLQVPARVAITTVQKQFFNSTYSTPYLGSFCLMSQSWSYFFVSCMYSPNSITWMVPATQNRSVWKDHGRPSCISMHVKPSVWMTCKTPLD